MIKFKWKLAVIFTLFVAYVLSPIASVVNAKAIENNNETEVNIGDYLDKDINIIKESENEIIYQIEEDGQVYEYVEKSTNKDDKDVIVTTVYIIKNGEKEFYNEYETNLTYDENSEGLVTIEQIDEQSPEDTESVTVNLNDKKTEEDYYTEENYYKESPISPTIALGYLKSKGGSYVADMRYEIYSNGTAYAIGGGYKSKKTTSTNWKFRDFKAASDNIRSIEKNLITGGWLGVADAIAAAARKGQLISITLVKKLIKKAGKSIPLLGTVWTLYDYGNAVHKAKKKYNAI
ncbi:hypothetical protein [Peribacillus butanolivorans]|uniref:hypothetical protein n=1 Tax=Peribacillus butanolivorans TaxID=421767 RepID=UPI0035D8E63B